MHLCDLIDCLLYLSPKKFLDNCPENGWQLLSRIILVFYSTNTHNLKYKHLKRSLRKSMRRWKSIVVPVSSKFCIFFIMRRALVFSCTQKDFDDYLKNVLVKSPQYLGRGEIRFPHTLLLLDSFFLSFPSCLITLLQVSASLFPHNRTCI